MNSLLIEIDDIEWSSASEVERFVSKERNSDFRFVCLRSEGGKRRWIALDGYRGVSIHGDSDTRDFEILLPEAAFVYGRSLANVYRMASISRRDDGNVVIAGGHESMTFSSRNKRLPVDTGSLEPREGDQLIQVSTHSLRVALASFSRLITTEEESAQQTLRVFFENEKLCFEMYDADLGLVSVEISAVQVGGEENLEISVNLMSLLRLLSDLRSDDTVIFAIPKFHNTPLHISYLDVTAALMPSRGHVQLAIEKIENVIEEVCGSLSVSKDKDGDYPLSRRGHHMFGRVKSDGDDVLFQVFAVVLDEVEESYELLQEVNQLNANVDYARVFFVENQILAEVDLLGISCDAVELRLAMKRIRRVAAELAPMIHALFGGEIWADPVDVRWDEYRKAVVCAQVSPTWNCALNGPGGVSPWPFPESVFVITGWNPQGTRVDGDEINRRIAFDILSEGGQFVAGEGMSPDRTFSEPSVVAWGISRDIAMSIGRRAQQDAIFELDADHLTILDCYGDKTEILKRIK